MSPVIPFFESIGARVICWGRIARDFLRLTWLTIYWIFVGPSRQKPLKVPEILEQMVYMGAKSIVIVFFVTFFTGLVLAMQSAHQLSKMGGTIYVASLVSISICRELGPVLTALVIAGRVGAAITAEIGSMKVNEQIEALETMAIHPVRFLVIPKVIALFFMLPCLTIIGDIAGMFGGFVVGVFNLGLSPYLYLQTAFKYLGNEDIYTGLSKAFIFALIIAWVGCYQGLNTKGGAVGVGRATTVSVVTSFILIIVADCLVTAVYYFSNI